MGNLKNLKKSAIFIGRPVFFFMEFKLWFVLIDINNNNNNNNNNKCLLQEYQHIENHLLHYKTF